MPATPTIGKTDQALTSTAAGDILKSTGPTGRPVVAAPGTDYSAPDVAETWTGVKTVGAHVVLPYTASFTFPNDPTVTDGSPFAIYHDHSPFALADDPILVIGYNQGPGLIPDKPSFTLTFEGGYKPSETYHTMEFNLDFYPNIEGKFAQRVLAISYNREQSLGAYGFLGSRGHFYNEDASVLLMQLLSRDETNGTTYPPQILTYVPLYASDDIFATRLLIDNPDHVPLTVVGAKTPDNELYSGFNIEWSEANNRFENQTTIGSGGIFFAQDGTIKLFSALSQAAGSEVTSKLSYNPSGVLSVGGPYDGTSGVAIEGHGVVKSRTTAGSATVQAQSPNVTLMMLANEGAGWGIFGTQTNHPLMFYSNNTRRGFADTDGTLYWGTGNVFHVAPGGKVTTPGRDGPIVTHADAATIPLDLSASDFHVVNLGGNRTLTLTGTPPQSFKVKLVQDGTGGWNPTWWSGITWWTADGNKPTPAAGPGKGTYVQFVTTGSGTYDGILVVAQP